MEALKQDLTWQEANWASGPKVAKWISALHPVLDSKGASDRALRRWRAGDQASFWALDRFLTMLGHHPSELPEEVWEPARDRVRHDYAPRYCKACGDEIPIGQLRGEQEPPARYQRRAYCSKECMLPEVEVRICKNCGGKFEYRITPYTLRAGRGIYCTRRCFLTRDQGQESAVH